MKTANKKYFYVEGVDKNFEGYSAGETWNGWDCPYFEIKTAIEILKAINEEITFNYDLSGLLTFTLPDEETEKIEPVLIMTNEGKKWLYALGAWAWCWRDTAKDELT